MLTPREKSPPPEKKFSSEEDRTRGAQHTTNELFRPQPQPYPSPNSTEVRERSTYLTVCGQGGGGGLPLPHPPHLLQVDGRGRGHVTSQHADCDDVEGNEDHQGTVGQDDLERHTF